MKLLGVDGGIRGGLAIVSINNDVAPQLVDAIDIPVIGTGAKERVDVQAIRDWIVQHAPQHAFIERAQAMPKQGASSGFKYGRAVGAIEAAVTCCAIPLTIVEPSMWKKFHRLAGGDKEGGRQRALELFPAAHVLLALKRHHNRGEAALIACFGAKVSAL
jgi:Holliday junction resolvasome RuvABC endonuclease subunit